MANLYEVHTQDHGTHTISTVDHHDDHDDFNSHLQKALRDLGTVTIQNAVYDLGKAVVLRYVFKGRKTT